MTRRILIVGGGHNGLVCAAYLARAGLSVTLLERRALLGGACVTEELWPGYRVSRAAYVLSLLRPAIARELGLERHGLRLLPRSPASITPLPDGRSLVLGAGTASDAAEIARFSKRDAERWPEFERLLERVAAAVEPLLDDAPPSLAAGLGSRNLARWGRLARTGRGWAATFPTRCGCSFGPARALLEEHFESEPLRATLATDAIIGAFASPSTPGTGYVLFHHVMGTLGGHRGVWAYVEGGMGRLSDALAAAAREAGAELRTDAEVVSIHARDGRACGVTLASGETLDADLVVSGMDLARTARARRRRRRGRRVSPRRHAQPGREAEPRARRGAALPRARSRDAPARRHDPHRPGRPRRHRARVRRRRGGTRLGAAGGRADAPLGARPDASRRRGKHVASIFAQYAPVLPADDPRWPSLRDAMRERVLGAIEQSRAGLRASIEHLEVLAAPDLERVFGLTGGNIFHGAMTPRSAPVPRPSARLAPYALALDGLWLCGAATHPGGGVMGACGRNAARESRLIASLACGSLRATPCVACGRRRGRPRTAPSPCFQLGRLARAEGATPRRAAPRRRGSRARSSPAPWRRRARRWSPELGRGPLRELGVVDRHVQRRARDHRDGSTARGG